jgi:transcriptional regulator with XRE-family HTH domain
VRFGELIRDQRDRKGLSQTQLAELSGVSFSVISRMERGETVGRADTIAKVTGALKLDAALVQRYLSDEAGVEKPITPSLLSVAIQMKAQLDELIATLERQQADQDKGTTRNSSSAVRRPVSYSFVS